MLNEDIVPFCYCFICNKRLNPDQERVTFLGFGVRPDREPGFSVVLALCSGESRNPAQRACVTKTRKVLNEVKVKAVSTTYYEWLAARKALAS